MTHVRPKTAFEVAIIGGGIMGLSTAWALKESGHRRVALIEQAEVGHLRGSSNGGVRIARSTYPNPHYVRLMRRAQSDHWWRLAKALNRELIRPVPGCFFGPEGGLVDAYAAGVSQGGADAVRLTNAHAAEAFPTLQLSGCSVIRDHTAGVIDARTVRDGLLQSLRDSEVSVYQHTTVQHIDTTGPRICLSTSMGPLQADRVVITAGAWATRLVPQLAHRLMVHRQDVGYYQGTDRQRSPAGDFAWVYLGHSNDEIYYGLPEDKHTLKTAHHRRSGFIDDPDEAPINRAINLSSLDEFVRSQFTATLQRIDAGTCPYTSTETDDFIIAHHPDDERITIGAGFSGHGFKFSPIIGEILAELATTGQSTIDEYNAMRHLLSIQGPSR
jgi:monomeric sarcosine oxidase